MNISYPYLSDDNFLYVVDNLQNREEFVKIIVLDWKENPITAIESRISLGSLNISGTSSIRRTASLTVELDDYEGALEQYNNLFSINKKILIEKGIVNVTGLYENYPIIWFPLGVFVLSDPSITNNNNGLKLSLSLKDKMALLNGESGGVFPASVIFDKTTSLDENNNIVTEYIPLKQIIYELVSEFGNEDINKIIINDIDDKIKMAMRWTGNSSLYYNKNNHILSLIPYDENSVKIKYGLDIGYIYADFHYPSELSAKAGDSVCTILDKIIKFLGNNYEYFYDILGNFIFQEKKNYLNTSKASTILNKIKNLRQDEYLVNYNINKSVYDFSETSLITSYNKKLSYSSIKNDYIAWGIRETESGQKIPIRYHLAIDLKPKTGNTYYCTWFEDKETGVKKLRESNENDENSFIIKTQDWRTELYLLGIYSKANKNYYYAELDNEWSKLFTLKQTEEGYYIDILREDLVDIDYFLDFIDTDSEINNFCVAKIGRRTKVVSNNDINCIFSLDIPDIILIPADGTHENVKGEYILVKPGIYESLSIGGYQNSAYDEIRNLLYQYTNYNYTISVSCIPIYHLEPNTRITLKDELSNISGDYIIKSISIPFAATGTSTILCSQALERI